MQNRSHHLLAVVLLLLLLISMTLIFSFSLTLETALFIEKAKEKEKALYPLYLNGVETKWNGMGLKFPPGFEGKNKKESYLFAIEEIAKTVSSYNWDERGVFNQTIVQISFTQEEPRVEGLTSFNIKLPPNCQGIGHFLNRIFWIRKSLSEYREQLKKIGASEGIAPNINDFDNTNWEKKLGTLTSYIGNLDDSKKVALAGSVWIFSTSWEVPKEYGVTSITIRVQSTDGKAKPVTSDMVVPPSKEIVINMMVEDWDALKQGIEKQF